MLRRCPATLLLLSVVATLAAMPAPALAAAATNYGFYQLTNTRPTAVTDLVLTNVTPPNAITPPDPSTSPLTILDGSFGFDPKNLQVFLSPTDPSVQGMAINFANGGLAPGGTLNFKVSLDPAVDPSKPPTLQLQAPDADLKLISIPAPPPVTVPVVTVPTPNPPSTSVSPPPNSSMENTPEPVSIALWSAMAGAGFLRARAFRRARRAAAFA